MPITVRGKLEPISEDAYSKISTSYQIAFEDMQWLLGRSDVEFAARYMVRDSYFDGVLARCESRHQWNEAVAKARRYVFDIYNLRKPYESNEAKPKPTCSAR